MRASWCDHRRRMRASWCPANGERRAKFSFSAVVLGVASLFIWGPPRMCKPNDLHLARRSL
eukprot:573692-Prorocentrum_minimum.AAC.2